MPPKELILRALARCVWALRDCELGAVLLKDHYAALEIASEMLSDCGLSSEGEAPQRDEDEILASILSDDEVPF